MKTLSFSRRRRLDPHKNIKPDVGAIIDLSIRRANGTVEHLGKFHNFLGGVPYSTGRLNPVSGNNISFYARDSPGAYAFTGTWQQVGTAITRVTNVGPNNDLTAAGVAQDDLLVFGTGERSPIFTITNASAAVARYSMGVAATTLVAYKNYINGFGRNPGTNITGQSIVACAGVAAYSNGVLTYTLSAQQTFPAALVAYTLRSIPYSYGSIASVGGATSGGVFHISAAGVSMAIGDAIVINSFVMTYTWASYQPVIFAAPGPIGNINQSGKYQRLHRVTAEESSSAPTRIFLLTDANKIVLPDMLGPATAILAPASYTIKETITVSSGTVTTPDAGTTFNANGVESRMAMQGTVLTGGTDIRQIAWGTTTQIFGAIEYDADVTVAAGKILTINTILRLTTGLEAP
jgi:hypothetical protein